MSRMSNPFDSSIHKTERTANQKLVEWINEIIKEKNIPLGRAEQETSGADRKQPDVVIYKRPTSEDVLCLMELKPPYFDPFDEQELTEPARKKATKRRAPYFCTSNFQDLIWFNTEKVNSLRPPEEQIVDKYHLSDISDLDLIERNDIKSNIQKNLEAFLIDLYEVATGKRAEPRHAIDEFLVLRLQEKIKVLAIHYEHLIRNRTTDDPKFSKRLQRWFVDQNWSFAFQEQDFKKAARQAAYLLVNKILFYDVLQSKRPQDLDELQIPEGLTKGSFLQATLQNYFNEVLKIDYETIYTTDFIDEIAFPDNLDVVEEVKELIGILNRYNFSKLGFDVIGRIFESLIPAEERHILGQYFTNSDVVDIILRFCLRKETDKVFDPGCGAGTFLVRAYQHKKLMNQRLTHEEILPILWGNDIAKFPAHLTTINLAINDLGVAENYPRVIRRDFFELLPEKVEFGLPEAHRRVEIKGLSKEGKVIEHPRWFDCVVGNPPYTRQEEIADISSSDKEYKSGLIKRALEDLSGRRLATISKRAGIHAYFFVHGMKFLQNGGRFGFIVSNSWLDVDYGKGLQEFFLKNCKIIAIIESKVERWFADADVNTCIVILEKCSGDAKKKERDENLARFAYLKKPLHHFIPRAQDMWEKQVERLNEIDKLKKTILAHNDLYENDELRIFPKKQAELWEEGFDLESGKYVGSKWGKYLRAPEIFFKILKKGKDKLVPLREVANVRFGIKTGANEFFYLTEEQIKKHRIEKEFWMHKDNKGQWVPNYVIKSPRECRSIIVEPKDLKWRVLMIHKDKKDLKGTSVLKYIREGEGKDYHHRPTCAARVRWYDLGARGPRGFLHPMIHNDRQLIGLNQSRVYVDHNLFEIHPKERNSLVPIVLFLTSTIGPLIKELGGRINLGEGALKTEGVDLEKLPVIRPCSLSKQQIKALEKWMVKNGKFTHGSLFVEIDASSPEEVALDKVKPDRRELDKIIMGGILGLTNDEQLEVYRAVIDLVKSRLDRAKSISKTSKTKEGIDIDALVQVVINKVGPKTLGRFYKEKILLQKTYNKKLPEKGTDTRIDQTLMSWRLVSGKDSIDCTSEEQARYLGIWLEASMEEVKVPYNDDYLKLILPELESLFEKIKKIIDGYLCSIVDQKTCKRVEQKLWQEITKTD